MGQFTSSARAASRHENVLSDIRHDASKERRTIRLLLLGLEGSGKSLFLAQLARSYEVEHPQKTYQPVYLLAGTPADDRTAKAAMRNATLNGARVLARAALASGAEFGSAKAEAAARLLAASAPECALSKPLGEAVASLWAAGGKALALAWDAASQDLCDNYFYLVKRVRDQIQPKFVPTVEDRLRLHFPTLHPLRVLLRKKDEKSTLHVAELPGRVAADAAQLRAALNVLSESALLLVFCVALSDFDRTVFDDPAASLAPRAPRNKLQAALDAWGTVATSPALKHAHITLLLTKLDIFTAKLETTDLRHPGSSQIPPRFLDYRGGAQLESALSYIEEIFHERAAGRPNVRIQAVNLLDHNKGASGSSSVALKGAIMKGSHTMALCTALRQHARQVKDEVLLALDTV
jgi:hypothetical protein